MRWSAAALLLLLLAALASPLEAAASVAEQLTEADAGYLWAGRPPRKTDRPGGWQEYWFSSDVAGGVLAVGDDANPCTAAAPCLTTAKMLSLAAPGVHIRLDHGDDWNTLTTFTASFDLDLAAIGCPAEPDAVCVWFSTTAPDSTLYTVSWGNAAGAPRHCLDVLSDGVDRGWAFFEGIAVRCDGSGTPTDADGLDTNLRGKLWCHNCPVQVIAADGSDNVATAHAGGVTVISGVSPLTLASGASGTNPAVATTGSSAVVIVSRSSIRHLQATYHTADVVLAACGGQCTPAPDGHTPAVALIGPRLECGSGCGGGSSLLELNPDPVAPLSPRATTSGLVAFTRFDHARSEGTHAIRAVLDAPNVGAWFRGYGNEYLTLDSVWLMWGTQLDPGSDLDVEDVGFVANEPAGGPGEDAAILYCADPDWRTAVSNFRLPDYQFDNGGGADSQCYLEAGAVDVISASMDGCQSGIDAVAPSGTWSVDGAGDPAAAGLFAQDLPSGIVLPDFVTGRRLAGVYFGGEIPAAIDVEPDDPANRIDVHYAGTIPVALLGSDAFDPAQVDATTLAFAPDFAAPADAGGPALDDVDGDGRLDLLSHYAMQDTGIALGNTEACLTGRLLDGRPFEGCDVIVILGSPGTGCGLGPELAPLIALLGGLRRRRARHRS